MTHTPGPWFANDDCIEADGPEGPRDVTLAVVTQADNAAANASLIAAAPELLATCKWLLDEVCRSRYGYKMHPDDRMELMGKLCEVIGKAEGRNK